MGANDELTDVQKELWKRIEEVRVAMLTTVAPDGSLRSRPMWTQGEEFDGSLWFFTSDEAPKVEDVSRNNRIELSYAAPDKDLYLTVSGRAELVRDRAKADELWNTFAQAWFPDGPDDPHVALLRVDVERAHYWEDDKPKVLQLAEIALGAITGTPPKSGEERELELSR